MKLKQLREDRAKTVADLRKIADKYSGDEAGAWSSADQEAFDALCTRDDELKAEIEAEEANAKRIEAALRREKDIAEVRKADGDPTDVIMRDLEKDAAGKGLDDALASLPEKWRKRFRRMVLAEAHEDGKPSFRDHDLAIRAWALAGPSKLRGKVTPEMREACGRLKYELTDSEIDGIPLLRMAEYVGWRARELRAMATTAAVGGETIPEGFVNAWELALLAFGGMRTVSTILRTATGNDLPYPHTNDTGQTGELLTENTAAAEQDVATGALVFNAYKFSSKLVKVSFELLQDSAFDIPGVLGRILGERIARITNQMFTNGTGSSQPNGIDVAAAQGVTTSGTAPTTDNLIDLFHSVDPAYRQGAGWMMHDGVIKQIRTLKDADDQYLWQPGLQAGVPDMLLGHPVTVNQDCDDLSVTPAIGDKPILFGALSKYIIRDVASLRLKRLVERYAEADQEAFVAFSRHDGDLLDAGTDPVKYLEKTS